MKIRQALTKTLSIAALASVLTAGAHAAVIIDYNTAIAALASSPVPTSVTASIDSDLVASSILTRAAYTSGSPSTGLNPNGAAGRFNSSYVLASTTDKTLSGALTYNKYYSFTVTPASEVTLDLSEITFSLQSSSTGATGYAILSSVDGFTIGSIIQQGSLTQSATTPITVSNETLGTSFDSLTSSVEFRIYVWGATTTLATTSVNTLQISGEAAAVPEPTTLALASLASAFMLWKLRRRRSARA